MLLPTNTVLGKLRLHETYYYYDEPKLLSCLNVAGQLYLVFYLGENEDEKVDLWLYVPLSINRLNEIKAGNMLLRHACLHPEDELVWFVNIPFKSNLPSNIRAANPEELTEDDLPGEKARLNILTPTILSDLDDIVVHAQRINKEILDISFQEENSNQSVIQISTLGSCLVDTQKLIEAICLAQLKYKYFPDKLPQTVADITRLNAIGTFDGSFGIRLSSTEEIDLFGNTDLKNILEVFMLLLRQTGDHSQLKQELDKIGGPVIGKLLKFYRSLSRGKVNIKTVWGSHRNENNIQEIHLNWKTAEETALFLTKRVEDFTEDISVNAVLSAADIDKKTFTLKIYGTDEEITGRVDADLMGFIIDTQNATLSKTYKATINVTQEIIEVTEEIRKKYILLKLEEL